MNRKLLTPRTYDQLISNVGQLIELGRKRAVGAVNTILVQTYWLVGKHIVEYEQKGKKRAEYGEELLRRLSQDLGKKYGRGFSLSNLKNVRLFYLTYAKSQTVSGQFRFTQKSQTVSAKLNHLQKLQTVSTKSPLQLSWSHYCLLINIDEDLKRSLIILKRKKN